MDTRESGLQLGGELLAAGLDHGCVAVKFAGVMPTAGVAHLTEKDHFVRGVMISASHNAFSDNGIKVFGSSGHKLPDDEEERVEAAIFGALGQDCRPRRGALGSGRVPRREVFGSSGKRWRSRARLRNKARG